MDGVVGGSVVLEVSVTGTDPIAYQWKHAGVDVEGGTGADVGIDIGSSTGIGIVNQGGC